MSGEDDGEEPVGRFDAPGAVDDLGEAEIVGPDDQTGLLAELADRGFGDGLARLALADGEVPPAGGELVAGAALKEDDAVGLPVVDDDGGDEDGHRIERGREGRRAVLGVRLGHCDPLVGQSVGGSGRLGSLDRWGTLAARSP